MKIRKAYPLILAVFVTALFLFQACSDSPTRNQVTFNPPDAYDISSADTSYSTDNGLQVHVIEQGDTTFSVVSRDQVTAYYTGRTIENGEIGEVFDSTYRNEAESPGILRNLTPSPIQGSRGTVSPLVDGFRRGIVGTGNIPAMSEGEKRVIVIPPALGYEDAQEGSRRYNLRNDTLRFDIELVGIQ